MIGRGNPLTPQRMDTVLPSIKQDFVRVRLVTDVGSEIIEQLRNQYEVAKAARCVLEIIYLLNQMYLRSAL